MIKILLLITTILSITSCGGGKSDTLNIGQSYLSTDASCESALATSGLSATVSSIENLTRFFGDYSVNQIGTAPFTNEGTSQTSTFTLLSPGQVSINGVTINIKSVCTVASYGANWRYISLINGSTVNVDQLPAAGSQPCANGDDFSTAALPRGSYSKCRR